MSTLNVQTITGVQVFDFANTPFVTAFNAANGALATANTAGNTANQTAITTAAAFNTANAAYGAANNVGPQIAPAFNTANAAFASANNVAPQVTPAFNTANTAYALGNVIYASVNSNWVVTNAAYGVANTALQTSGGTVTGTLSIVGDLVVSGNVKQVSANTLSISDPLIYLAANNYASDVVDIGFIANYVNATSANVHTGLYRSSGTKEYYLFYGYDKEPINNYIDPTGNNIQMAVLNSTVRTSNLILGGANAIGSISAAFAKANAALANTTGTLAGDLKVSGNLAVNTFIEFDTTIGYDYTITTGRNAFTAGPVSIANGNTVTIPSGSYWTVT